MGEQLTENEIDLIWNMVEYDMNITKIAEVMFVHKNTIYYWINRIKAKTGYDPRSFIGLTELLKIIEN